MDYTTKQTMRAFERIRRSSARSPTNYPEGMSINYELQQTGVKVRCIGPNGYERSLPAPWSVIYLAFMDPLPVIHERLVVEFRKCLKSGQ